MSFYPVFVILPCVS